MKTRVMVAALVWGAGLAGSAAGQYQYFNLGAVTPRAASADGSVVTGDNNAQYFAWTAGSGVSLIGGTAPSVAGAGGQPSISDDGRYIAGTAINPSNANRYEMSRYDRQTGQWTNLGGIGGVSGSSVSSGWGISGDGNTVVGLGWVNAGTANAVRWNATSNLTESLGTSVAGRSTRANAVNGNGSVIAGWQDSSTGFRQGAVWVNGVQTLIADAQGNPASEASDVTTDGRWVVGAGNTGTGNQAWRWSAETGYENLGSLPNNTARGSATGIADNGTIIGFQRVGPPAVSGDGFIWFPGVGMVNLTQLALNLGVPLPAGYRLALPLGISADGNTIVGIGAFQGSFISSGWVITIPAPGSAAVLAVGGLVAARRRR